MSESNGLVRVIPPIEITDSSLSSTTIAENDHPVYSAATTYNTGDLVIVTTGVHKIYECQADSTLDVYPPNNPATWTDRGATNAWKLFDRKAGSLTSDSGSFTIVLEPGERFDSLALLQVEANYVDVSITANGGTIFNETYTMLDYTAIADFYQYLFAGTKDKSTLTISSLPTHSSAIITITFRREGGTASCGVLVIGKQVVIGELAYGYSFGLISYSSKTTSEDGTISVKKGNSAKVGEFPVIVENSRIDLLLSELPNLEAIPAVYVGGADYEGQTIYGYYERLEMLIPHQVFAEYNLEIQGII